MHAGRNIPARMNGIAGHTTAGASAAGVSPAVVLTGLAAASGFWSTALVEVFSVLLVLLFIRNLPDVSVGPHLIPLLIWGGLVAGMFASVFASPYPASAGYLDRLWHAALFPAALLIDRSKHENIFLLTLFTVSGAAASVAAITSYIISGSAYAGPVASSLTTYSSLLALAGPCAWYLLMKGSGPAERVVRLIILLLIGAGVFFSARAVPILVLSAGSAIVAWAYRPWSLIYLGPGAAALLWVGPEATRFKLRWLLAGGEADRYLLWKTGVDLLGQTPFLGFGPLSFPQIFPRKTVGMLDFDSATSWHNDFLTTTLESGWLVGFLFAAGVLAVLSLTFRRFAAGTRGSERASHALGFSLALGATLIAATASVLSSAVLGAVWWLLMGICFRYAANGGGSAVRFDLI